MTILFAPHAKSLFQDILLSLEDELSTADAIRWHDKIIEAVTQLADFPLSCPNIPLACFLEIPPNPERLRQLICKPYRIVYEVVGEECRILSIRHGRMLVTTVDTRWN